MLDSQLSMTEKDYKEKSIYSRGIIKNSINGLPSDLGQEKYNFESIK